MGCAEAPFSTGVCLSRGEGVRADARAAFYWYFRAARQGHADAAHNLGYFYREGKGVARNPRRAEEWYARARKFAAAERAKRKAEGG